LSRNTNRPFALDYSGVVFSEFLELHGDREFADDPAIVAGLASLDGRTVGVVGHQKGRTTQDRLERRFGTARPVSHRKALRVVPAPEGGAHEDYAQAGGAVRQALTQALAGLETEFGAGARLDHARLLHARFEKYRRVGVLLDPSEPEG